MANSNPRIPEWFGDPDRLPIMGEMFLYRGNRYYWMPCACPCRRPSAFKENGEPSYSMTLRVRGENTGFPDIDILIAVGATIDEIADAHDKGGGFALAQLFDAKMALDPIGHGLTSQEELKDMIDTAMRHALGLGENDELPDIPTILPRPSKPQSLPPANILGFGLTGHEQPPRFSNN